MQFAAAAVEAVMLRVSVKNTFLSFNGCQEAEEPESGDLLISAQERSKIASPRSRSVECSSPTRQPEDIEHPQIHQLNRLLDDDQVAIKQALSPVASPSLQPNMRSGYERNDSFSSLPMACGSGYSSPPIVPSPGGSCCGPTGPSEQELHQLKQRLEEVCQAPRRRPSEDFSVVSGNCSARGVPRVLSNGSVCSMGTQASEESQAQQMPNVRSNGSICSLNSGAAYSENWVKRANSFGSISSWAEEEDEAEWAADTGPVEFDLLIEEGTEVRTWTEPDERVIQSPGFRASTSVMQSRRSKKTSSRRESPRRSHASSPRQPGIQPPDSSSSPRQPGPQPPSPPTFSSSVSNLQQSQLRKKDRQADGTHRGTESPTLRSPGSESADKNRALPKEYRHGHVPKTVNLEEEYHAATQQAITTLMIRNIPNRYTQKELISELEDLGFASTFDFLYIPLDKGTMSNVGYAFVNFISEDWAQKCIQAFQNYRFRRHRKTSGKIAAVSVAHLQGLDANLAHYENAAVNTAKLKQRRPLVMANISKSLSMTLDDDDE